MSPTKLLSVFFGDLSCFLYRNYLRSFFSETLGAHVAHFSNSFKSSKLFDEEEVFKIQWQAQLEKLKARSENLELFVAFGQWSRKTLPKTNVSSKNRAISKGK